MPKRDRPTLVLMFVTWALAMVAMAGYTPAAAYRCDCLGVWPLCVPCGPPPPPPQKPPTRPAPRPPFEPIPGEPIER